LRAYREVEVVVGMVIGGLYFWWATRVNVEAESSTAAAAALYRYVLDRGREEGRQFFLLVLFTPSCRFPLVVVVVVVVSLPLFLSRSLEL
jgi:hypothetical protein